MSGPQEHERLAGDRACGVVEAVALAFEADPVAERALLARVEVLGRPAERCGDDAFLLALERLLEGPQPPERQECRSLALGEHVCAVSEVAERRALHLSLRELEPDRDRQPDREHDRDPDRREQAAAERAHRGLARYPMPRTVWISSGRSSLRRSDATCMSIVRVPAE